VRLISYERACTVGMLHRFLRASLLVGRMPSVLGREIFRSRVSHVPARVFEDSVVFVCDVERCLRQLEPLERRLIAYCVFEDRSEWEAARRFHCSQSDVSRRLGSSLDLLYETFCRTGLLKRLAEQSHAEIGATT